MRVIPDDSAEEFRSLRPLVSDPVHTVVVARHGLEWWAGYFMHTPVRDRDGISDTLFGRYDRVLFLVDKGDHSGFSTAMLPDGSALIHDGKHFRVFDINDDRAADRPR
jgi:hypothetical protein